MISAVLTAQTAQTIALYVICLVMAIAVHEYCHAWAAHRLGDQTPEREDRLTLNPISHADPIGTLLLPLVAALLKMPLFGWGKPVPTQPRNYTRKVTLRTGLAIVAVAGPLGNLLLVLLTFGLTAILQATGVLTSGLIHVLGLFGQLNVVLMIFNLLPIHPLDGGKILAAYLPPRYEYIDDFLMRNGYLILLGLLVSSALLPGGGLIGWVMSPAMALFNLAWLPLLAGS